MASAISSWPTFDMVEIAQEASERAGIEFRSGYSLKTARRALELLSIEWANRGLNLWTIEGPITRRLVPHQETYSLEDDTIDLIEHVVRTRWGPHEGQFTDLPLDRMTLPEYANIPNKKSLGRPTILTMRRSITPYFHVWMVPPPRPRYELVYWRLRRMLPLTKGGTGEPEIPWRFIPAIIGGLAYYMSLKSTDPNAVPRIEMLKAAYEEQFTLASDEDRDRASFRFVPGGYEWWL